MSDTEDFKICRSCSIRKPLPMFYWRGGRSEDARASCKSCTKAKRCLGLTNLRERIYQRDNFTCYSCDKNLFGQTISGITLDHVLPMSKGGDNSASNLITCCKACNLKKFNSINHNILKNLLFLIEERNRDAKILPTETVWFKKR